MSRELTVTSGLRYDDGTNQTELIPPVFSVDVASALNIQGVLSIGASRELLPYGEVVTPGFAIFENTGAENISLANDLTEAAFAVLQPGQTAQLPLGSATVYAWAATTSSTLRYLILST